MVSHRALTAERPRRARLAMSVPLSVFVGLVLALSANAACAAALGNLATSVGLLAALAALFVIKGWPAHLPASAMSTAAGVVLIVAGAAWMLWRARAFGRAAALVGGPERAVRGGVPGVACARPVAQVELPAAFDREALLADLRQHFVRLQHAWDHGETTALQTLTTPEMLAELSLELPGAAGGRASCTEVVTLRAELLGFESLAQVLVVSVEFSGLLRESSESGAVPFRELWLLTQSKHEPAVWRLARHQALI